MIARAPTSPGKLLHSRRWVISHGWLLLAQCGRLLVPIQAFKPHSLDELAAAPLPMEAPRQIARGRCCIFLARRWRNVWSRLRNSFRMRLDPLATLWSQTETPSTGGMAQEITRACTSDLWGYSPVRSGLPLASLDNVPSELCPIAYALQRYRMAKPEAREGLGVIRASEEEA